MKCPHSFRCVIQQVNVNSVWISKLRYKKAVTEVDSPIVKCQGPLFINSRLADDPIFYALENVLYVRLFVWTLRVALRRLQPLLKLFIKDK